MKTIAVLPGDGIGPEVMAEALKVLDAAAKRFDLEFTAQRIDREVYAEGSEYLPEPVVVSRKQDDVYSVRVSYVKDNTIWGYMGPVGGTRYFLSFDKSIVDVLGSDLNYNSGYVDFRKYFRLTPSTQLAFRLSAATSQGAHPAIFYLGGGYTLRGYPDFEFEGNNMAFASLELRYPFIDRLVTRFSAQEQIASGGDDHGAQEIQCEALASHGLDGELSGAEHDHVGGGRHG